MEIKAATHANLQKEIEISKQNAVEMEAKKQLDLESSKVENMSKEKIALMNAYGYENGEGDTATGHDGEDTEKVMTNRDHAAAVSQQNTQKQRSGPQTKSKLEARQETKAAKAAKDAKKEERRKRAGKKERQKM